MFSARAWTVADSSFTLSNARAWHGPKGQGKQGAAGNLSPRFAVRRKADSSRQLRLFCMAAQAACKETKREKLMRPAEIVQRIGEVGVVPVVRAANAKDAAGAMEAILAGGIPVLEITMTVPDAPEVISETVRRYGSKILIGAGTVLTREQAELCLQAGAQFLVSPGLAPAVIEVARSRGVLAIPGALSPTELAAALQQGAELIKIFPCGSVGGPPYLKALHGPFPAARLIPTGGVTVANAGDYISAGAFAVGVGGDLVDQAAIRSGNSQKVVAAAKSLVESVRQARESARKTAGG